MDIKIITPKGFAIDASGITSLKVFCEQLNDRTLLTLPLAGMVLSKRNFKTIIPTGELTGGYELITADGESYVTDIPDYDAKVISDSVNNQQNEFVLIGNIIIQRHNFDMVRPTEVVVE
ncbi:MAG: hypothetical protein ABS920_14420 [Sporosarcina sp.]